MPKFLTKLIIVLIVLALIFFIVHTFRKDPSAVEESSTQTEDSSDAPKKLGVIVLDAGHGGPDPGKVGINDVLEKNINLSIVLKIKPLLEEYGFDVHLTRDSDAILGPANSAHFKRDDMIARVDMIKQLNPFFTISIHQNSFPKESVKGPQVFYYKDSVESATMAQVMQNSLNQYLNPQKKREAQSNTNYYLLTRTPTPTVIVECGFLSNPDEAALLATDAYQQKVAEAVSMGVVSYYESNSQSQIPSE